MSTAVRTPPHHNTTTCYTEYRCRLPECVTRYNTLNQQRLQARRAGTYDRFVNAEPVRRHIQRLQRKGMAADAIATAAGLSTQTILEFVRALPSKSRGRRQRTTPTTAAKILAVTADARTIGRIDATGTRRRMQALLSLGWPIRHIAAHAGLHATTTRIPGANARVYVSTAKAIAATYDELRKQRPDRNGVTKAHAHRTKNLAARNGWLPPRYWDQHPGAIDDPFFVPMTNAEVIASEAWFLTSAGVDRDEIAARLGVSRFYVDRSMREHPELAEVAA